MKGEAGDGRSVRSPFRAKHINDCLCLSSILKGRVCDVIIASHLKKKQYYVHIKIVS